jgi:transposase
MARHGAEWWAKRIEELAQGGDAEEIASRHGVRTRTLIWWRSQLRRKAREKKTGKKPRLLPVVVRAAPRAVPAPSEPALEVFVEVGAARMTLRGAVTAEHLAAIVAASARAC